MDLAALHAFAEYYIQDVSAHALSLRHTYKLEGPHTKKIMVFRILKVYNLLSLKEKFILE